MIPDRPMTRSTLRNWLRQLFVRVWRCRSLIASWIACWMPAVLALLIALYPTGARCIAHAHLLTALNDGVRTQRAFSPMTSENTDLRYCRTVTWTSLSGVRRMPIKNCQFTATVTSVDYYHVTVWLLVHELWLVTKVLITCIMWLRVSSHTIWYQYVLMHCHYNNC